MGNRREVRSRQGGLGVKFYTIKLPRFIGGIVRAIMSAFYKQK
nr:stage V sporulation protein SpoVM [Numidum massiliense]